VGGHDQTLQVDRALFCAGGFDDVGTEGGEAGDGEFVGFIAVAFLLFAWGNGIRTCGEREPVDGAGFVDGGEVEDAFSGPEEVLCGFGEGGDADHAAPAQPEDGGDGGDVVAVVGVGCADEYYGCAEIENGWITYLVHCFLFRM